MPKEKKSLNLNGRKWNDKDARLFVKEKAHLVEELQRLTTHLPILNLSQLIQSYIRFRKRNDLLNDSFYKLIDLRFAEWAKLFQRNGAALRARWSFLGSVQFQVTPTEETHEAVNGDSKASPIASPEMILMPEHKSILEWIDGGRNIFFTGKAGTGKSYLLTHIIKHLRVAGRKVAVTAPTTLAASHIQGSTLHKFAGWRPNAEMEQSVDELVSDARRRKVFGQRWRQTQVLIIDEISMVNAPFFEKMDAVARVLRGCEEPWGGIQLILCGDFWQLPPVNGGFCFEATNWTECIPHQIELMHVFRQSDDHFLRALAEIRFGICSDETNQLLCTRLVSEQNDENQNQADRILPTALFSHRVDVKRQNEERLAALPGQEYKYVARDSGAARYREGLNRECNAPEQLMLKLGAQVVVIKNMDNGLYNGCRGVVVGFVNRPLQRTPLPRIKYHNGMVKVMDYELFRIMVGDQEVAAREQIPLELAWALTIHKAQGMTLDTGLLDLARCFEPGQVYVALSRIRSLEGLLLQSWDRTRVKAHPKVLNFFGRTSKRPHTESR